MKAEMSGGISPERQTAAKVDEQRRQAEADWHREQTDRAIARGVAAKMRRVSPPLAEEDYRRAESDMPEKVDSDAS